MNDEIKEILSYLKKKENTRRIKCITIEESKQLLDYITNLQQENDNYKAQKYITDFISENGIICEKNKQIQELTNNWNELEEYIKDLPNNEYVGYLKPDILDKMKEIKGGKDEK